MCIYLYTCIYVKGLYIHDVFYSIDIIGKKFSLNEKIQKSLSSVLYIYICIYMFCIYPCMHFKRLYIHDVFCSIDISYYIISKLFSLNQKIQKSSSSVLIRIYGYIHTHTVHPGNGQPVTLVSQTLNVHPSFHPSQTLLMKREPVTFLSR